MSHFVLMGIGVVLSIASIFTFALGWEMWRDSLNKAYVSGLLDIHIPGWRLSESLEVRLAEPDGTVRATSMAEYNEKFRVGPVDPGGYVLELRSRFVDCQRRSLTLNKGSNYDLGAIPCTVNERANWSKRYEHSQLLSVAYANDTIWLTGFRTNDQHQNSYVLFRANDPNGKFENVVVPKAAGAERGSFITSFETGELLFATYGKGAFISTDEGIYWEPLPLPTWVKSVRLALERRPGNWLLVAAGVPESAEVSSGVPADTIFETNDSGTSWTLLGQLPATTTSLIEHVSGRLVAGSDSVFGTAGILVSEDGGLTWSEAQLPFQNPIRGIGVVKEIRGGMLVAGTLRGLGWKNTHLDGKVFEPNGAIISSRDGGLTWKYIGERGKWEQIEGIAELPGNVLVASSGNSLIWSTDIGQTWASFGKPFRHWVRDIGVVKDRVYVLSTSELVESPLADTIIKYATRDN